MGGIKDVRLHKCLYQALIRLLLKELESKFEAVPTFNLEELSLGLSQEEFERVMKSHEFQDFGIQSLIYAQGMKDKGTNLAKFSLSYSVA